MDETDKDFEAPRRAALRSAIAGRLNAARHELLDLTTRNRLISTTRHSRSSRLIEVSNANGSQVYRELVTEGRAVGFAPREPEDDFIGFGPEVEDDTADGPVRSRREMRLQTSLTAEGLRTRLLGLHLDAKTFEEEQGVGILYVAIGFLKWYEAPNSDVERYAPLILVPVNLDRGTARERFKLRWNQEDPAPNLSVIAMLREQAVTLPEWEDQEDLDPEVYFESVTAAVSDQPRWAVEPNDVVVGFFSFAKFLMYRDLDAEHWPEHAAIDGHTIVSALLGDGFEVPDRLLPEEGNLDEHLPSLTTLHVLDADSSQSVVIEEARRGRNLVVQGPPGTGKSQTIANIIAAAVDEGHKVLFVAEKMAALDVVKRRLDAVGVGDMCLELHSKKANKREVLQELNRTWLLGSPSGAANRDLTDTLDSVRQHLSAHPARLQPARHDAAYAVRGYGPSREAPPHGGSADGHRTS